MSKNGKPLFGKQGSQQKRNRVNKKKWKTILEWLNNDAGFWTRPRLEIRPELVSLTILVIYLCHECLMSARWLVDRVLLCSHLLTLKDMLGVFNLKRHCTDRSVYDFKVPWEWFESMQSRLLSVALTEL